MASSKIHDLEKIWKTSTQFPWYALVTTGRVGSDFFQSLLDGHPEIYGFNGHHFHHEYWEKARTTRSKIYLNLDDVLDEYLGHFIHKFKSIYDIEERKNELGENKNQTIDIDLRCIRNNMTELLSYGEPTRKDFLRALYISWALALGWNIEKKKLFFHHVHHFEELSRFLDDYPNSKVIVMTRDPRASYVSGVEHWRRYNTSTDHGEHVLGVLKRSIIDVQPIDKIGVEYKALRLEDLGSGAIIQEVCDWLDVEFHKCLNQSTFGGLRWWADRLSKGKIKPEELGFSPSIVQSNWGQILGPTEKAVLNYLLSSRLEWYGYPHRSRPTFLFSIPMILAILVPTRYERRLMSWGYLTNALKQKKFRWVLGSFYSYIRRIIFFYSLLFAKIRGQKFVAPYFRIDSEI